MPRTMTKNESFTKIFTVWEKLVNDGMFPRIGYNTYSKYKSFFVNKRCRCGKSIDDFDAVVTSSRVIVKCDRCSERLEFAKDEYLGGQLAKYIENPANQVGAANDLPILKDIEYTTIDDNGNVVIKRGTGVETRVDSSSYPESVASGRLNNNHAYGYGTISAGATLASTLASTITTSSTPPVNSNINNDKIKGGNNMLNINSMFKGFQFGPVKGDNFKLSPMGTAFKAKDGYVVYNVTNDEMTDVTGMTFDMNDMIFALPVSHAKVAVNDIILHNSVAVIVKEVKEKSIIVVYPGMSEIKEIMPVKNMFGFNFYTKIMPLLDLSGSTKPDADNPFGNLMPLMLMSQGTQGGAMNPMMLMALMGDKLGGDKEGGFPKEMMLALAMSGQGGDSNGLMTALMMSKLF